MIPNINQQVPVEFSHRKIKLTSILYDILEATSITFRHCTSDNNWEIIGQALADLRQL